MTGADQPRYETPPPEALARLTPCVVNEAHGKNYRRSPGGTGWICAICFPVDDPPDWQLVPYERPLENAGQALYRSDDPREELGEIPTNVQD